MERICRGKVQKSRLMCSPHPIVKEESVSDPMAGGDTLQLNGRDRQPESNWNEILPSSNLSVHAMEFIPQNLVTNDSNIIIRIHLVQLMEHITLNPGMFDTLVETFLKIFNLRLVSLDTIKCCADLIFKHSVKEQNFTYHGAKLCHFLMNIEEIFRNELQSLLKHESLQAHFNVTQQPQYVHGLLLFMVELLMQLQEGSIPDLTTNVFHVIYILLTTPSAPNLKCVCQVLKLAGHKLQKTNRNSVDDIADRVLQMSTTFVKDTRLRQTICSVMKLKVGNWQENDNTQECVKPLCSTCVQNDPVFYGPDGKVLTVDEIVFLEKNATIHDDSDAGESMIFCIPDDHMDEEMEAAYEEFLESIDSTARCK